MKAIRVAAVASSVALAFVLSDPAAMGAAAQGSDGTPGEVGNSAIVDGGAGTTAAELILIAEKLGQLERAVESLRNSLPASGDAAAGLKPALDGIEAALLETRSEVQRLPSIEQISAVANSNEMKVRLDRLIEKVDSVSGDLKALDALRQDLKAFDGDKSADGSYPRLAMIFSAVAAAFGLGAILSVVMVRPKGGGGDGATQRRLGEMRTELMAELARISAGAPKGSEGSAAVSSDASAAVKVMVASLGAAVEELRAQVHTIGRDREARAKTAQQIESAGARLQPVIETIEARVRDLESERAAMAGESTRLEQERQAAAAARTEAEAAAQSAAAADAVSATKLEVAQAALAEYDKLWPDVFRDGGPLAPWRSQIVHAAGKGGAEAGALLTALMRWQAMRLGPQQQDRERWLEATDAVGRACHVYLATEPAENDAANLERLQQWTRAFKTPLEEAFPSLKLNAAYPGDRFDTDRMEAVSSISGGRQTVHHPLSWFVLEKSGETTRVLRRAQVTTA